MGLLWDLIQGESAFDNRWIAHQSGSRSTLTFTSHGLPDECNSSPTKGDETQVNVLLDGQQANIKITGKESRVYPRACAFAIYSRINLDEIEGLNLVAGNLNQISSGERLYLEFSANDERAKDRILKWMEGRSIVRRQGKDGLDFKSNYFQRFWAESACIMLLCFIGLILSSRLLIKKEKV